MAREISLAQFNPIAIGEEKSTIEKDIVSIATNELNVKKSTLASSVLSSFFGGQGPEAIVKQAIIDDAKKMASDKSYQVDIGV